MKIKTTMTIRPPEVNQYNEIILEEEDYRRLRESVIFINDLHRAVVRDGAAIPQSTLVNRLIDQVQDIIITMENADNE